MWSCPNEVVIVVEATQLGHGLGGCEQQPGPFLVVGIPFGTSSSCQWSEGRSQGMVPLWVSRYHRILVSRAGEGAESQGQAWGRSGGDID